MVLFPSQIALNEAFSYKYPFQPNPEPQRKSLPKPDFSVRSVTEDAKSKASALSQEAKAEITKASSKAQAKTGQIELYSGKYYAACIAGGLIACVGILE